MMEFLFELQLWVYGTLRDSLDTLAVDRDWLSLAAILPLGALFGALHALTPGHSKAVLATYVVGSRSNLWQGMGVAGVLAATHVGMAVVLALLGLPLITRTIVGAGRAPALEDISSFFLLALGVWLLINAVRRHAHSHHEGLAMGAIAGLIPCPLTLFVMFASMQRGVPEIGLLFACAMLTGVMLVLGAVALTAVVGRQRLVLLLSKFGTTLDGPMRVLQAAAGVVLMGFAAQALVA